MQGGPLNHTIAAKATCFAVAASDAFRDYQRQVRANADTLSSALEAGGLDVLTGGTDTHLLLVDLRRDRLDGQGRGGAAGRGRDHRQPEHDPVRRASADRVVGPPPWHAGDDDARLRRGRLPRGRRDHVRRPLARTPTSASCARGAVRSATRTRFTLASAATRATSHDRHRVSHPLALHKLGLPPRPVDVDRRLPPARQRADAPAHVRGDEGSGDGGRRGLDAARADDRPAHLREEGRRLPDPPRRHRHARRRPLPDLRRPRRLHRPLSRRGDAPAARVLREAPAGRRRA